MSPIAHAGAGAASKDVKKESATARLLGSGKIISRDNLRSLYEGSIQLIRLFLRFCWYRRADGLPSRTKPP